MDIIVVGDGNVGSALAEQLSVDGHNVTIIDQNPKVLKYSAEELDVICVHGNGASYAVQKDSGVEDCDLLIGATSKDEINIMACLLAKKLGAKNTIVRILNLEYIGNMELLKQYLGLSLTINPELAAAEEIANHITLPSAKKIMSFAEGKVYIAEYKIGPYNKICNKKLYEFSETNDKILICAVERDGDIIIPTGYFQIQAGDIIHVAGYRENIAKFWWKIAHQKQHARSVMIVGGGITGLHLAHKLSSLGMKVKIIEERAKRCAYLSENLPDVTVMCGDGTNQTVLLEEDIDSYDALVALTASDEENILISLAAKQLDVKKVICRCNSLSFVEIFNRLDIGSIICPKMITAFLITQFVRAMQNTGDTDVITTYKLANDKAELSEFRVCSDMEHVRQPLSKLKLIDGVLIAAIVRGNKVIMPKGKDFILPGDRVIIVTSEIIHDLDDIFV